MESSEIYRQLAICFANHKYCLRNQYVFNWESDFFGMSDSGYGIEVEVKVSLADYRKDFLKPKHKMFEALFAKKDWAITNEGKGRGDELGMFISGELKQRDRYFYGSRSGKTNTSNHWFYTTVLEKRHNRVNAPATRIRIIKLEKELLPSKFYFAVPKGMNITVPAYAGLIEISEKGYEVIKKAPFLHKRPVDYWKVLLDKFYYKGNRVQTETF